MFLHQMILKDVSDFKKQKTESACIQMHSKFELNEIFYIYLH